MTPFIMTHRLEFVKALASMLLNSQNTSDTEIAALWKQKLDEMGDRRAPGLRARIQEVLSENQAEQVAE